MYFRRRLFDSFGSGYASKKTSFDNGIWMTVSSISTILYFPPDGKFVALAPSKNTSMTLWEQPGERKW